jgi:hypothetical protein
MGIIASAWNAIPARTILRCWQQSGICQDLMHEDATDFAAETYVSTQEAWCRRCVQQILPNIQHESFQLFWQLDENFPTDGLAPDPVKLVDEAVAAGVLERGPEGIDLDDIGGDPVPEEIINGQTAIKYLAQVNRYLRSLPETELRAPQGRTILARGAVESNSRIISGIFQYVLCFALTSLNII